MPSFTIRPRRRVFPGGDVPGDAEGLVIQPSAGQRALLDRRAVEILDDARLAATAKGEIWIHAGRPVLIVDVDKVGGA